MGEIINEMKNIVISETFLTVISGVLVFVLSQLFNDYWLKPTHRYKDLRSRIAYSLVLYANLYMNPVEYKLALQTEEREKASTDLRKLAAEVCAMAEIRPLGNVFILNKKALSEVSRRLIGLPNNIYSNHSNTTIKENTKYCTIIYKLLKLKTSEVI